MTLGELYDERYAPQYETLFVNHPLRQPKLQCNLAILGPLLKPLGNWVDTCCGQGWHLAQFPHHQRMGIDLSAAQLEYAKEQNPGFAFIEADPAHYEFPDGQRFHLVTNFWSSYSYLDGEGAIAALVQKLVRWTAPGGSLYLDLTVPELLEDFNDSEFAVETGARVVLQSPSGVRWHFHDAGGIHQMVSANLNFFVDLITPHFPELEHEIVIRSMRQLVARDRRPD